ncbi:YncE family protein [Evansella sp. AB-P1]|uniref:YVTN family beta-propeller repeat protein n=1 Tax=Evansella sp. AB-P1 TaxID=3037653 RepID=UPI00241FD08B|nr:cytochrome D1 domain-containing protein [Evansella sp. AB-P1]MDG5787238.1 YncE family protein [Evansella sp. AB-P1]
MLKKVISLIVISFVIVIGSVTFFFVNTEDALYSPIFYVANAGDGTISVVDLEQDYPVKSISLNKEKLSHGIAISPNEKTIYYGSGSSENKLYALDVSTQETIHELSFNERVHGIDIHPSGKYVYVSLSPGLGEKGGYLAVVDTQAFEVVSLIITEDGPAHVSVANDGSQIWVTNVNSNSVSVIDSYTYQLLATIPVGEVPNEVALSPNFDFAYTANVRSNSISVIDMITREVVDEIEAGEGVHGVTVSPDGKEVWTANNHSNDVSVIDTETRELVSTIETGSYANHISFSPEGDLAFVTHRESNSLIIINRSNYSVIKELDLGVEPHEMTLKGMLPYDIELEINEDWNRENATRYQWHGSEFVDGVEVVAQFLSPYNDEDTQLLDSTIEGMDPSKYFALKIDMSTHSGDLSTIPFEENTRLLTTSNDELEVANWIVVSNDSHHPQYIALFNKTIDRKPLLVNKDTTLTLLFRPFIGEKNIEIELQ